jgi:4-amino-4-deoxy-L-arabinose transferase-like glycosyltransferase
VLVVVQVAAIVALGTYTIVRFPIFDGVDEGAHVAYIAEIAEHGRIPVAGTDLVPWQVLSIERHVYPRRTGLDPRKLGLAGLSYEAWQPPLYYVLAAPAFLIPTSYLEKVRAVRAFNLGLVLAALLLLALLAKAVFDRRWLLPYGLALSILLWPGVLVRAVTVSNEALELPLVCLFLLIAWRAAAAPTPLRLVATGFCFGLCVLTQLTLVCLAPALAVPVIVWLRRRRDRGAAAWALAAVGLPVLVLAPWLWMNLARYGTPVGSSIAERITATNFPPGPRSGAVALRSGLARLGHALLPQEWWPEYQGMGGAGMVALAGLPLLALAPSLRRPSLLRTRQAVILGAPLLLCLLILAVVLLKDSWPPALFPRYLNAMLAPFVLYLAWAWINAWPRASGAWLLSIACAATLAVGAVWAYMALAYYSTHLGATVGIHANAPP